MSSTKPLKVYAFNGSAHKDGHTTSMINIVFEELRKEGIECEMFLLGGTIVRGCRGCNSCVTTHKCQFVKDDDPLNVWMQKSLEADGIILASPVHYANVSVEMKAYIDHVGRLAYHGGQLLKNKIGLSLAAAAGDGAIDTICAEDKFFGILEMPIVSGFGWTTSLESMNGIKSERTIKRLREAGRSMAFLLKKYNSDKI